MQNERLGYSSIPSTAPRAAVLFALRRESMFFRRTLSLRPISCPAPCRAWLGPLEHAPILMLETGLGAAAMEQALRWCLRSPFRPRIVLSAGFSGALQPEQRVGDLILATDVTDESGDHWPTTWPDDLPPAQWESVERGRLLTVPRFVAGPEEKRRLGHEHRAAAVDMETAVAARLCQEQGVPFGCLRVISDDLDTPLSPRLVDLLRHGRVSPWRLAAALLRQPALGRELWRLAAQTRRAAQRLSLGLEQLLAEPRP